MTEVYISLCTIIKIHNINYVAIHANVSAVLLMEMNSGVYRVGLKGVSKSRKLKWLVKVGVSKGVTHLIIKKSWPGGGVPGQPENPPGYATDEPAEKSAASTLILQVALKGFQELFKVFYLGPTSHWLNANLHAYVGYFSASSTWHSPENGPWQG